MGDFNIDLLQYESNTFSNDFINLLTSHSLLPSILQPTRVTDHSSTIIDNIFSNASDSGESVSGNITTNISEHFIQFMFIKKYHISYKACNYFIHDYSKFGKEKFIHDFSLLDWSLLDESNKSVNEKFDYFYSAVSSCINGHAPKKKLSKKNFKLRSKPWINSKTKKLMYLRDRMFNKANKDPTPDNKYLYRKFRNRVVAEQRKTKVTYFKDYFEKYKTNMKMLWSGIRSLVNIKNRGNLSHISNLMINLEVMVQKHFRAAQGREYLFGPLVGGSGDMFPQKILKITVLRLAENAFPTF